MNVAAFARRTASCGRSAISSQGIVHGRRHWSEDNGRLPVCSERRAVVEVYKVMTANRALDPGSVTSAVPGLSRSGLYANRNRPLSRRSIDDEALSKKIVQFHKASKDTYGAPRIHADLANAGVRVGRKRVERLMKRAGIQGVSRRKGTRTTFRDDRLRPAGDLGPVGIHGVPMRGAFRFKIGTGGDLVQGDMDGRAGGADRGASFRARQAARAERGGQSAVCGRGAVAGVDGCALRNASGDVFGRIYEYFLAEFSKQGAHDNGEFFTPPSIVQTIVNVIEPDHGIVFDPACGSGGMFVQSSHFIEDAGQDTMKRVTFYGHEKNETTAKLAQINLAVHGLQGTIRAGNEAITYYKDPHELVGKCDFVMANPPFNVDEVDADKVKGDKRLPFGLPGVNKAKKVSNANYLWMSYFYSYLNQNGRAAVVMSSQASSAGRDEAVGRQKLVETGAVDVMIDIRGNFFYTRTVPCQLWF